MVTTIRYPWERLRFFWKGRNRVGVGVHDAEPRVGECLSIGAFTHVLPIKSVKAALKVTDKKTIRNRQLPNHVVVYYVIGMAMMMTASYRRGVKRKMSNYAVADRRLDKVLRDDPGKLIGIVRPKLRSRQT